MTVFSIHDFIILTLQVYAGYIVFALWKTIFERLLY